MSNSKIEQLICDRDFSYLRPYFYNNPYALRCALGVGADAQYMANARNRALELYNILFPFGADAIVFDYWIVDYSDCAEAEKLEAQASELDIEKMIDHRIESEGKQLRFLLENQGNYRHYTVRDLKTYDDADEECMGRMRRNRVVCYRDEGEFDYNTLIDQQLNGDGYEVGFVSFQNECIFSIYDDRGCDIVFATHEKMKEFYHKLKPYFLPYDAQEMENRLNQ